MRCRQLLSLSVTLATVLVLVKCETAGNTPPAQEKASGDPQDTKTTIGHEPTAANVSATTNDTVPATASPPETVKPITHTTAPKKDGTTSAPSENRTNTTPEGYTSTVKSPVNVTTTTPKPHNSTSSALTALSAITLCVLSLTVSL